jgi:hypothetical protein
VYARVTQLEIDTMRIAIADALEVFREAVLPGLREQPGYEGTFVLCTPEGKAVLMSLWANEDAAVTNGSAAWYTSTLQQYATMFKAPPGREHYKVLLADMPAPIG